MIKGVAHVCFFVSNLEQSIQFYRDKLGLKPVFEFHKPDGRHYGQYFHAGERTFIELFEIKPTATPEGQSFHHFCLEVDDIQALAAQWRERGVAVSEIKQGTDRSWQAWLADPDGNRIELHQYTPESKQQPCLGG